jgi:hypothetical protein
VSAPHVDVYFTDAAGAPYRVYDLAQVADERGRGHRRPFPPGDRALDPEILPRQLANSVYAPSVPDRAAPPHGTPAPGRPAGS